MFGFQQTINCLGFYLIVCGVLLVYRTVHAQGECRKPPNPQLFKTCCKIPESNTLLYPECAQHSKLKMNPCFLECIFNVTGALQDGQYNANNMRTALMKMYSGKQDIVDNFINALNECDPEIKKRIEEFQAKSAAKDQKKSFRGGFGKCSPIASFYVMCAHRKAFINCPKSYWTESPDCESAKNYTKSCDFMKGGMRKRNSA